MADDCMTSNLELTRLTALNLRQTMERGEVRALEVAAAHLDSIAARERKVQAWTFLDADHVMLQARMLDRFRSPGSATGPLHGIRVGLKDIFDTRDMPTCNGTPLDAGRRPQNDAFVVARLREAGAIIMGKTATTELAVINPCATRNPLDPERTPGGSSSGSAAAVATFMVPLALGTQTNGSVIRSASFCGVVGYKPSRGMVSRRGVLTQSPTLDSVGVFARSIDDAALLGDILAVYDPSDETMRPQAKPQLLSGAAATPPLPPVLAFMRTPVWDRAEASAQAAFAELCKELGTGVDDVELPQPFDRAHELHRTIMLTDIARNFAHYDRSGRDQLSAILRGMIDEGRTLLAVNYTLAQGLGGDPEQRTRPYLRPVRRDPYARDGRRGAARPRLDRRLRILHHLDLLRRSSHHPAPAAGRKWIAHRDAVGRRGGDARLMRTANWLMRRLGVEI
jgi:Asp-tRNA(Asn)/Glu-tRNA(Gln) amidotransferase A subunit family amidase